MPRRAGLVVVSQFIRSAEPACGKWSVIDVLYDHFGGMGIPVLGGLPIGHGPQSPTFPLAGPCRRWIRQPVVLRSNPASCDRGNDCPARGRVTQPFRVPTVNLLGSIL